MLSLIDWIGVTVRKHLNDIQSLQTNQQFANGLSISNVRALRENGSAVYSVEQRDCQIDLLGEQSDSC